MRPLLFCGLVLLVSSSLVAQRSRRGCPDITTDSLSSGLPVYKACQVEREAKPRGIEPRLDWQPPLNEVRNGGCYRAEYEFVVDTLGFPEIGTIRDVSVNNSGFGQSVKDIIPRLRYDPAQLHGAPVRQTVAYQRSVAVRVVVSSSPYPPSTSSRPPRC